MSLGSAGGSQSTEHEGRGRPRGRLARHRVQRDQPPERVSEQTRTRVLAAIAALGFVRNESARQLRGGGSRTLAYVVLDASNPFFTDVARGVQEAADAAGLAVYLCDSRQDTARQDAYLDLLEQQRVEGVLVTPVGTDEERIRQLAGRGTPVVLVDRSSGPGACSVAVDDVLGGDLAVTHLLELGHRRIIFVGGPDTLSQVRDRVTGARRALGRPAGTPATWSYCTPRRWTSRPAAKPPNGWPRYPPATAPPRRSASTTWWRSACCSRPCGWVTACRRTWPSSATTTSSSPRPPRCR